MRNRKLDTVRLHSFDPLRSPRRRRKRLTEVLRFVEYFVASKLVDVYGIPRLSVVGNYDLAYPKVAAPTYSQHFRYAWMIRIGGALSNEVRAAAYPFARLRDVTNDVLIVHVT